MILYLSSDWHCHKTISKVQNKQHLKTSKLVSEWNQVSFTGTCYIEMKDIFKTNQKSNQLSAQIFILKGKIACTVLPGLSLDMYTCILKQ